MKKISLDKIDSRHIFTEIYGDPQTWANGDSWSFEGNPRKDHGFMLVLCKQVNILLKNGELKIFHAGDLLSIPKNSEYLIHFWDTPSQHKTDLLINYQLCDTSGKEYCLWPQITCIMQDTPLEIRHIFEEVGRLSQNFKNPYFQITKRFFSLLEILKDFRLANLIENKSHRAIYKAIAYMETHICDPLPIPELARMCAMSETGFRALFRQQTGVSPSQYRTHLKIEKAKNMLRTIQDNSIAEIGSQLGFCDTSYFIHVFIRHVGVSPGKYRQASSRQHPSIQPGNETIHFR